MFCDVFGARGALPWGRSADTPSPQGIPQAVLLGHDWGGMVVWNMALFYPERVRWVLGSPPGVGTPQIPSCPHGKAPAGVGGAPMLSPCVVRQSRGLAQHAVPPRRPHQRHRGEDEGRPHLGIPVLLPGAGESTTPIFIPHHFFGA